MRALVSRSRLYSKRPALLGFARNSRLDWGESNAKRPFVLYRCYLNSLFVNSKIHKRARFSPVFAPKIAVVVSTTQMFICTFAFQGLAGISEMVDWVPNANKEFNGKKYRQLPANFKRRCLSEASAHDCRGCTISIQIEAKWKGQDKIFNLLHVAMAFLSTNYRLNLPRPHASARRCSFVWVTKYIFG